MASVRLCGSCGEPLGDVRANCKRHPACARKHHNQQTVALARAKRLDQAASRCCVDCGDSIDHRIRLTKYCEDCKRRRDYAITSSWHDRRRPPRKAPGCVTCGVDITGRRSNARYCTACRRRRQLDRISARRAVKRGNGWASDPRNVVFRDEIFARDGFKCHICNGPTAVEYSLDDPLSPVIDHLIPLALPESPGHVPENLACAHQRCNRAKGARVRPEDWDLYHRLCRTGERTA